MCFHIDIENENFKASDFTVRISDTIKETQMISINTHVKPGVTFEMVNNASDYTVATFVDT